MAKTKIISSSATQMETLPSMVMFKEGTYYPVYANIYKFPNGNLTSAMLLTNGRYVAMGAVVVARHEDELLTQQSSSNASTQTEYPINPPPKGVSEATSPQEDAQRGAMGETPVVLKLSGSTSCPDKTVPQDLEIQPHLEDSPCLSGTLEPVNPTRITVAQGLNASEDGDIRSPSAEDNEAIR